MDLSALLAREGIQADDADVLVAWARQRAAALVTRIEPNSALARQLGAALEQARSAAADAADVPVRLPRPPSRGTSRPMARSVSRPHLGAAVQAALTRNEPALERVLESAEMAVEPAPPPAPPPAPTPVAAEPDDEDASIGGFNRFAFSVRRRAIETRDESGDDSSPTLTRGFEIHAEESTSSGAWQAGDLDLPEPPGFEARAGQDVPSNSDDDGETSGGLVVGIPDEEGIDIPLPRARPRSESRGIAVPVTSAAPSGPHAASSGPHAAQSGPHAAQSGPHAASSAPHGEPPAALSGPYAEISGLIAESSGLNLESSGLLVAESSGLHAELQAARSSEVLEYDSGMLAIDGIDVDIPEPPPPSPRETTRPQSMARMHAVPQRPAPPPPPPARSGPHARASALESGPMPAARTPSAPMPAARTPSAPAAAAPATRPPSAPEGVAPPAPYPAATKAGARGRSKTSTAEQKQVKAAESKPAAKKGKGRKKIVELSQPVVTPTREREPVAAPRKASIGNHLPTSEPSSAGRPTLAYLVDDDE
jgi:hypothetical protein